MIQVTFKCSLAVRGIAVTAVCYIILIPQYKASFFELLSWNQFNYLFYGRTYGSNRPFPPVK